MEELTAAYTGPVERDAPLADKTNFRLGGRADWLFTPQTHEQVSSLLNWIRRRGLPLTVLGEGSNVLVRDGGIRGAVLRIGKALGGLEWQDESAICGAGLPSSQLARLALEARRGGFVWAASLPGNLGGALCMNAGCFGGEMADCFLSLRGWKIDGSPLALAAGEIVFSYRHSSLPAGAVVTELTLNLPPLGREAQREAEELYGSILARRSKMQPGGRRTAGSTFRNPPGDFAGRLIEACGLKGRSVGGARVSERHANFIVADGEAVTAGDVEALIELIETEVERSAGIRLKREIKIYGEA